MEQTILFVNNPERDRERDVQSLRPFSTYNSNEHRSLPLTLIAAVGENLELGKKGDLIWFLPGDLKRFKELTMGGAVIMGRKTWESLPRRPLPGRLNIVVTGNDGYEAPGAVVASSLPEALQAAVGHDAFIIGGGSLYRQAMPLASRLEITEVKAADSDADTWFPPIDPAEWRLDNVGETRVTPDGIEFRYLTYSRKQ